MAADLPIIQKTYDLIKWYVPILNQLPRDHKFQLGDRMIAGLGATAPLSSQTPRHG